MMRPKVEKTLFGEYVKEYYNGQIIENDYGFIIFYIKENVCMIDDLFVLKPYRCLKTAESLAQQVEIIAKEHRCEYLEAEAFTDANTYKESIGAMKYYGFEKVEEYDERRCELWRKKLEYV